MSTMLEPPAGSVVLIYGATGTAHQRHHYDDLWHDTAGRVYTWENLLRLDLSGREPILLSAPEWIVEKGLRAPDGIVVPVNEIPGADMTVDQIIAKRVHDAPDYWTGVTRQVAATEWEEIR